MTLRRSLCSPESKETQSIFRREALPPRVSGEGIGHPTWVAHSASCVSGAFKSSRLCAGMSPAHTLQPTIPQQKGVLPCLTHPKGPALQEVHHLYDSRSLQWIFIRHVRDHLQHLLSHPTRPPLTCKTNEQHSSLMIFVGIFSIDPICKSQRCLGMAQVLSAQSEEN